MGVRLSLLSLFGDGGRVPEDGGQMTDDRGQMTEDRGHPSEICSKGVRLGLSWFFGDVRKD